MSASLQVGGRDVATLVRFAAVGAVNTAIDVVLFLVLHAHLGILVANFVSSGTAMTFSFVVNGLFTFRAQRLTLRHAVLFVATTGVVLWLVQPLMIHGLLALVGTITDSHGSLVYLLVKLAAVALCLVANFAAYRYVVWPVRLELDRAEPHPVSP